MLLVIVTPADLMANPANMYLAPMLVAIAVIGAGVLWKSWKT